jgi:hypothetical protein
VLIDGRGDPVIIDVEGLMYFDVEWEHVFLRLRFGPHYGFLDRRDLDRDRLALYKLATHLSLVAGPLRLLDGDFPQPGPMRQIAEHHTQQLLGLLLVLPGDGRAVHDPAGGPDPGCSHNANADHSIAAGPASLG